MKFIVAAVIAFSLWLIQSCFWAYFWKRGLSATVEFTSHAVIEGEKTALKEIVTNNKFLPLPILHVKFKMGRELVFTDEKNSKITDQNYRSDIFACMPWQEIRRTLTIDCTKRGYYAIDCLDLVSYDMFLYDHFVTSIPTDTTLYVYPKPVDPLKLELPLKNLLGQIVARQALLKDPFEMQNIRPYQTYDTFRDINWKATARTGKMKVNVHAPTASWQVAFLLDVESDSLWKDYSLMEESIRVCASMSKELICRGIPVSLFTNGLDCLYNVPGYLDMGAGKEHLRSITELLSRIIVDTHGTLSQPMAGRTGVQVQESLPMEEYIEQLAEQFRRQPGADTTIYVLLSARHQERLTKAYASLCRRSPGSQWIMPHRPGDLPDPSRIPDPIRFFQWEVPYEHA